MEFIKASDLRYRVNKAGHMEETDQNVSPPPDPRPRGLSTYGHVWTPPSVQEESFGLLGA